MSRMNFSISLDASPSNCAEVSIGEDANSDGNLSLVASASDYYASMTNAWYCGYQTNVLAQANQRLSSNTNDIAGLLMKASYDFDFADSETLSNTLVRVLLTGSTVVTPVFSNAFEWVKLDIRSTFKTIATETPEEHASDMLKVQGAGHPMAYEDALKALDDDGYFVNCPTL